MKKYYILLLALLLVSVIIYFLTQPGKEREQSQTPHPSTATEPDDEADRETGTAGIPDMKADDDALVAGNRLDFDSVSPTILTHAEILEDVTAVLEGLRLLDPAAVQRISPLTATGEYNPIHYMLAAALENPALHGAFRKLGGASDFEAAALIPPNPTPTPSPCRSGAIPHTRSTRCSSSLRVPSRFPHSRSTQHLPAAVRRSGFRNSRTVPLTVISIGVLVIDDVPPWCPRYTGATSPNMRSCGAGSFSRASRTATCCWKTGWAA